MTPRVLKRLEDLLRVATAPSAAQNERELAAEEALSVIVCLRSGARPPSGWEMCTTMRFEDCAKCGDRISPAQRAWRRDDEFLHRQCFSPT